MSAGKNAGGPLEFQCYYNETQKSNKNSFFAFYVYLFQKSAAVFICYSIYSILKRLIVTFELFNNVKKNLPFKIFIPLKSDLNWEKKWPLKSAQYTECCMHVSI